MPTPVPDPDLSSTGGVDVLPRTFRPAGELDLATRCAIRQACLADGGDVIVDLSDVSFMDCSAFGGLMAAADDLRNVHCTLSIINPTGQPACLLALIAATFETFATFETTSVQQSRDVSPSRAKPACAIREKAAS